jgi:hypothetical protein
MGGIVSGISGILGGVQSAQNNLLNTEATDQEQLLQDQATQDQLQTSAQETTSWANTMNTIAKEFEDVSQSKTQADAAVAKASSDATKQA